MANNHFCKLQRAAAANNFFDSLAAKYGGGGTGAGKGGKGKSSNAKGGEVRSCPQPSEPRHEGAPLSGTFLIAPPPCTGGALAVAHVLLPLGPR